MKISASGALPEKPTGLAAAILPGAINLRIVAFIVSLRLAMHEAGN
jgi:hypothetical protein